MAIAFDAASSATNVASSLTFSHTCAGSDRALTVGVAGWKAGGFTATVTYNAVNVPAVSGASSLPHSGNGRAEMFCLAAPATGANNIVVTASGSAELNAGGQSYTGVDQTTPADGGTGATGTSTAATVAVTSAAGDLAVCVVASFSVDFSPNSGETERWETNPGGGLEEGAGYEEAGAASVTIGATLTASQAWGIAACNLNAAAGGGGGTTIRRSTLALLGVQ